MTLNNFFKMVTSSDYNLVKIEKNNKRSLYNISSIIKRDDDNLYVYGAQPGVSPIFAFIFNNVFNYTVNSKEDIEISYEGTPQYYLIKKV